MKARIFSYIRFSLFILMCFFSLIIVNTADAQQCQLIRIAKETIDGIGRIWLYPKKTTVAKGTCVIWMNWVEKEKVSITFQQDANKCIMATESPSGFKVVEACYFTDFLSYGETASLYFKEPGTFTYRLEIPTGKKGQGLGYHGEIVREGTVVVE